MVALFLYSFLIACCRVHSDRYTYWKKAIAPAMEAARCSIPVVAAGPSPVVEIVGAGEAARVGEIAPEPAGPSPVVLA